MSMETVILNCSSEYLKLGIKKKIAGTAEALGQLAWGSCEFHITGHVNKLDKHLLGMTCTVSVLSRGIGQWHLLVITGWCLSWLWLPTCALAGLGWLRKVRADIAYWDTMWQGIHWMYLCWYKARFWVGISLLAQELNYSINSSCLPKMQSEMQSLTLLGFCLFLIFLRLSSRQ